MSSLRYAALACTLVLAPGLSSPVLAARKMEQPKGPTVEERLARMERLLDSQGLVDMMVRIEGLQSELQRLRGEIEVQNHTLEDLKRRQRELYLDIDRRMLAVERKGSAPAAAAPGSMSGSVAAGAAGATAAAAAATRSGSTSGAAGAASTVDPAREQQAYQKAFDLLRELRYDAAIDAFRKFLKDYPNGRYAHIAQYWLAEANYAQQNFKAAIADYQKLIDNYPNSPKLAEAMLKIGYSYSSLRDYTNASASLERLIKAYPGTTEAGQAKNELQKIKLRKGG